jgi:hypothetical protein
MYKITLRAYAKMQALIYYGLLNKATLSYAMQFYE